MVEGIWSTAKLRPKWVVLRFVYHCGNVWEFSGEGLVHRSGTRVSCGANKVRFSVSVVKTQKKKKQRRRQKKGKERKRKYHEWLPARISKKHIHGGKLCDFVPKPLVHCRWQENFFSEKGSNKKKNVVNKYQKTKHRILTDSLTVHDRFRWNTVTRTLACTPNPLNIKRTWIAKWQSLLLLDCSEFDRRYIPENSTKAPKQNKNVKQEYLSKLQKHETSSGTTKEWRRKESYQHCKWFHEHLNFSSNISLWMGVRRS